MYLTNLAEAKKNGFFIASTQMSYDENDKYFCLYSVGFTSLGLPEIVIKNVHKSFKATATSVFIRVYQILTAGTPFLPGHGVSSNGVKYIVAQPSKSELRQLQVSSYLTHPTPLQPFPFHTSNHQPTPTTH